MKAHSSARSMMALSAGNASTRRRPKIDRACGLGDAMSAFKRKAPRADRKVHSQYARAQYKDATAPRVKSRGFIRQKAVTLFHESIVA
jgi:hypothetical protein